MSYIFAILVAFILIAAPCYFILVIRKSSNEDINNRREKKAFDPDGNILSLNTTIIQSLMLEGARLHGERIELDRLYVMGVDNVNLGKAEFKLGERTKDFVFRARAAGLILDKDINKKIKR
ncbi:MAG: hypothetical protein HRT37_01265 [Alteromonadaceae bacterium]|nr:hypothetical protein [Alteromonadaceae bacterium]